MKVFFLYFLCSITIFSPAFASEEIITPTLSTIYSLAKETVAKKIDTNSKARIQITPQNLEGRISPPQCYPPLNAELASDRAISRNNMVKLSCESPEYDYPWQMYISVRVEIQYPVVVANQLLSKDQIIDQHHLKVMYVDQYNLKGQYFSNTSILLGSRVKRRVSKDSPILSNNLCFVCKGDTVSIYAKTTNVQIKTIGEALRDGNIDDVIKVKNSNTEKQFDALVIGVGEVEVRM